MESRWSNRFFTGHHRAQAAEEALRESEKRYRALASSADSMYLVDRECRYEFMNAAHLLDLVCDWNEVTGRAYGDFHSEEEHETVCCDYVRCLKQAKLAKPNTRVE